MPVSSCMYPSSSSGMHASSSSYAMHASYSSCDSPACSTLAVCDRSVVLSLSLSPSLFLSPHSLPFSLSLSLDLPGLRSHRKCEVIKKSDVMTPPRLKRSTTHKQIGRAATTFVDATFRESGIGVHTRFWQAFYCLHAALGRHTKK